MKNLQRGKFKSVPNYSLSWYFIFKNFQEKMKEGVEFYGKFAERQAEIMEDPTKIDIEKFHEMCPVVHGKVAAVIEVVNEAVQFCRGDKAESHPFLPALVEKWFGWFCSFNKDQLVGEFFFNL
jgi:hypothetical protein